MSEMKRWSNKKSERRAGALVQWLWEETHVLKGRGFESQYCILDGHFPSIFAVKIVMFA